MPEFHPEVIYREPGVGHAHLDAAHVRACKGCQEAIRAAFPAAPKKKAAKKRRA